VACLSLAAIFVERSVLVFPSVLRTPSFPYGLADILITVGFAALFLLSYAVFVPRLGLAVRADG
jgi:hypothetical protein